MASVQKVTTSKGVRYRARYRDPQGKSREKWFEKKGDADKFLVSVQHKVLSGAYVDPQAGRITFRTYAEGWREMQAHRDATTASVETNLRRHVYPVLGDRPIGAVQRSEVQAFIKGLELAPATVELIYRYVAGIFRSAVDDQVIPVTPCRRIALPEKPVKQVIIPTAEQVSTLVDSLPERYRALAILCAGSGLRRGEALGLTVDRVDWLRRTVTIDRQLSIGAGKVASLVPPKTKASHRVIPVPDVVLQALTEHRRRFGDECPDRTGIPGLIFTDEKGHPIQGPHLGRIWKPAREAAGLPDRTGLHLLRHFYASALIRHGESVKVVQSRLGHASAAETLDTYSHLWPDSEERTREAVGLALADLGGAAGHQVAITS